MKLDYERGEHFREGDTETKPLNARQQVTLLIAVLLFGSIVSAIIASELGTFSWGELAASLVSTFLGAAVTVFWLEIFIHNRREQETEEQQDAKERRELIADIGFAADDRELARILYRLTKKGWLFDGSVSNAQFRNHGDILAADGAKLTGCLFVKCGFAKTSIMDLSHSHFYSCTFEHLFFDRSEFTYTKFIVANFTDARIFGTSFEYAHFMAVIFTKAWIAQDTSFRACGFVDTRFTDGIIHQVDFRVARFTRCQFDDATVGNCTFDHVHFEKVSFDRANLIGCSFFDARFIFCTFDGATLPDGTLWNDSTDMTRFTDPSHPEFWEPDWVKEPKPSSSNQL